MSVASRNPFALLDDEPSAPAASAPAKKESAPAPSAPAKKSNAPRGGKYPSRGGGRPRDSAPADEPAEDGGRRKFDGEGRGRGRGGRGRGDRGGRGRGGPRGERLDRHSATGKTDTEKKVSQGWGAEEGAAELNAEVSGAADAAADAWGAAPAAAEGEADPWASAAAPADGAAAPAEGEAKGDDRRRRERTPEEEDNTVSYEEYLAQKAAQAEADSHALREANDGADDWTSSVQELKKSEEDAFFVGKQKAAPKAKAKKDEKVFLEIDARFERPQRGGFGGRGRGEGRGRGRGEGRGRGRGEGRGRGAGPRQAAATINVDDESAFPSLS